MFYKKILIKWVCIFVFVVIIFIYGFFNNGVSGGDFIFIIIYIYRMNFIVKLEINRFWYKLILFGYSILGLVYFVNYLKLIVIFKFMVRIGFKDNEVSKKVEFVNYFVLWDLKVYF